MFPFGAISLFTNALINVMIDFLCKPISKNSIDMRVPVNELRLLLSTFPINIKRDL